MRVVHVMPSMARTYGGPTQSLIGFVRAASFASIESTVITVRPSDEDIAWLESQVSDTEFLYFKALGTPPYAVSPGLLRWLHRYGRQFDVAHIHGLFNPTSSLSAHLCRYRGIPLVIRPFGTLSRYTFKHRRVRLKKLYFPIVDRPNLRGAQGVHFTTDAERREAARLNVDFQRRGFTVPPPLNGSVSASVRVQEDDYPPTVLFLSRLHPKKNVDGLLKAWRSVLTEIPEAHLVVAGTGASGYVGALRQQVLQLEIHNSVTFAGFVSGPRKQALLRRANMFVLPSHQENFGVAVLEALAAGLPAVVSPQVQLSGFVREHSLGCVVERSPEALARGITRVLRDDRLQHDCAQTAPEQVKEHFSAFVVGDQLRSMYAAVSRSDL